MRTFSNTSIDGLTESAQSAWLQTLFYALLAAICVVLLINLGTLPLGRDQATFSVIGGGMLEGRAPYSEAWDIKTPGIFIVYALAHAIFGSGELAPRALEVCAMLALALGYFKLTDGMMDRGAAAVSFVIALYSLTVFGFWHTGQPETYAAVLLVWAVFATQRKHYFVAGALYVFAAFLKPSFGGGIVPSFVFAILMLPAGQRTAAEIIRIFAVFAVGGLTVAASVLCYLWLSGALSAFMWTTFTFLPNYLGDVSQESSRSLSLRTVKTFYRFAQYWPVIVVGCGVALIYGFRNTKLMMTSVHLLAVAVFPLIGVALQSKFFPYHYIAAIGPVALVAGWGLWRLATQKGTFSAIVVVVATVALVVKPWPSRQFLISSADRVAARFLPEDERIRATSAAFSTNSFDRYAMLQVADWVNNNVSEDAPIFVWGFDPTIYLMTDRLPPTRFIMNFPQRVNWSAESSREELIEDLTATPPEAIIVSSTDLMRAVTGNLMDSRTVLEREYVTLRQFLEERYTFAASVGTFDVYAILDESS